MLTGQSSTVGAILPMKNNVFFMDMFSELGLALARETDYAGAAEHLKIAAQGTDPEVKASALALLQRLAQ